MLIRLTKLSDRRHRLEVVRADRTREAVELETRSFLLHDFIHYAVESEAELRDSFWGGLAGGRTMAELYAAMKEATRDDIEKAMATAAATTETATTEAVVGVFTGLAQGRSTPDETLEGVGRLFEAQQRAVPPWLTLAFAERVKERLRHLTGEWRALPYGETMELTYPFAGGPGGRADEGRKGGR